MFKTIFKAILAYLSTGQICYLIIMNTSKLNIPNIFCHALEKKKKLSHITPNTISYLLKYSVFRTSSRKEQLNIEGIIIL